MAESLAAVSHRGIPEAKFVEDVDAFMKEHGQDTQAAEAVLRQLDERHGKYKFMESSLSQKKKKLKLQIPELQRSVELLKHMQTKQDSTDVMETHFLLADQVYAMAKVPPSKTVCLWLGANVMVEYGLEEAHTLLSKNLAQAQKNLSEINNDLGFLRDQCTTTEVNMARVYNWDVQRRRAAKKLSS